MAASSSSAGKTFYMVDDRGKGRAPTRTKRQRAPVVRIPPSVRGMYRVGGSMGAEKKYVDGYLDSTNIVEVDDNDATWAGCELNPRQQTAVYGCLPVPRQGTNYADRDGRRIMIKSEFTF